MEITKGTQEAEARAYFAGNELAREAVARVAVFGEGAVESLQPGVAFQEQPVVTVEL